jgi:hypothetical protein
MAHPGQLDVTRSLDWVIHLFNVLYLSRDLTVVQLVTQDLLVKHWKAEDTVLHSITISVCVTVSAGCFRHLTRLDLTQSSDSCLLHVTSSHALDLTTYEACTSIFIDCK